MPIVRIPPNNADVEPVYLYDDPSLHPITLSGIYIDQKNFGRIRSIPSTPEDIDRLVQTPLLAEESNLNYATLHSGGPITKYQRKLDLANVGKIKDWWSQTTSLSANPSLVWLRAGMVPAGFDNARIPQCAGDISPATWAVNACVCGATAVSNHGAQYATTPFFDHCRNCGWNGRPGMILDGQHRIRGMADCNGALPNHREQIFVSLMLNQPPQAVNEQAAARMFIEINAGATKLTELHEDYLASHFGILTYKDAKFKAAYDVARNLNLPAMMPLPNNQWYDDTTAGGAKVGRVSLVQEFLTDFIKAKPIQKWVMTNVGREYEAIDGAGLKVSAPVYAWPAPPYTAFVAVIVNDLSNYLRAITNSWPGATGVPLTPPAWYTGRGTYGDLQRVGVIRVLLNLLPSILRRLDIRGAGRSVVEMENELKLLSNVTWRGVLAANMVGDTGVGRVTKILKTLLIQAPNLGAIPPVAGQWPGIIAWMNGPHDPFYITNFTSTATHFSFEIETVCDIEPIKQPLSIIGEGTGIVSVRLTTVAGIVSGWIPIPMEVEAGLNTIPFPAILTPAMGDTVEIEIKTSTNWNENMVVDLDSHYLAHVSTIIP